jgi:7,8-dihydropterin-6-yl-methyl-4-(beta-D-ribofuranosyl)aminobenzene 5'-phosphate synthase
MLYIESIYSCQEKNAHLKGHPTQTCYSIDRQASSRYGATTVLKAFLQLANNLRENSLPQHIIKGGIAMNKAPLSLKQVDRVEIITLIDNYVDVLLQSSEMVTRPPLSKEQQLPTDGLVAEHGLSQLVRVFADDAAHSVLFDTGYTKFGVPHNLEVMGIDLAGIEAIVMSHGHMDHTGSLYPILESLGRPVPVVVHPEGFHTPRYFGLNDGRKLRFPVTLSKEDLVRFGGEVLESREPVLLADGNVLVTGEVERTTPFEKGLPNATLERNGKEEKDPIRDDQALVIHLKGKGLVIVSGCAHAGIVNTVLHAKKITGVNKVYAVIGGFHLSGPTFEPIIEQTVKALKEMNLKMIVPMHCTGWKAIQRFSEAFPDSFVLNSVGTTFSLS